MRVGLGFIALPLRLIDILVAKQRFRFALEELNHQPMPPEGRRQRGRCRGRSLNPLVGFIQPLLRILIMAQALLDHRLQQPIRDIVVSMGPAFQQPFQAFGGFVESTRAVVAQRKHVPRPDIVP